MSVILEIGCGSLPGPYCEDSSVHYIVDKDINLAQRASARNPNFTVLPGDGDATNLPLKDGSIDTVLARNVFGDPALGMPNGYSLSLSQKARKLGYGHPDVLNEVAEMKETASVLKLKLMREAFRVLDKHGRLILVEQYTAMEAREYLEAVNHGEAGIPIFERVDLHTELPRKYADYHKGAAVWVGLKPSL